MARNRTWVAGLLVLGLLLVALSVGVAAQHARGKVKSVAADGNEMVITDEAGKDWTYRVSQNTMIICPTAKEAKLADIKTGFPVSVLWEKKGDQYHAKALLHQDGEYRNAGIAEGKFKSGDNARLIITDDKGKDFTYQFDANTSLRQGNRAATPTTFKAGDKMVFVYNKQGDTYQLLAACNPPE